MSYEYRCIKISKLTASLTIHFTITETMLEDLRNMNKEPL